MKTQSTTTQFLTVLGGTIAYDIQGKGPLVICLPAGGDIRASYRFVVPQLLEKGYTVVTMDIRGQGEASAEWDDFSSVAMADDVVALINHLNLGPATLVGNSKAGGIIAVVASKYPTLTSGLVMASPFARTKSDFQSWLLAEIALNGLWGNSLFHWYFDKMQPGVKPVDFEEHRAKVDAMLKEKGRLRAMRRMFSLGEPALDGHLAKVTQPVVIVMGEKDPDFPKPEAEGKALVALLSSTRASLVIAKGAGHHPQVQSPELVVDAVIAVSPKK
jgi:pimeloyl-ACP methyl ester carboxylesterase